MMPPQGYPQRCYTRQGYVPQAYPPQGYSPPSAYSPGLAPADLVPAMVAPNMIPVAVGGQVVEYKPVYVVPVGGSYIPNGATLPQGFVAAVPPGAVMSINGQAYTVTGYGPSVPAGQHVRSASLTRPPMPSVYRQPMTPPNLSPPDTPQHAHTLSPRSASHHALRHHHSVPGLRPQPLAPLPELVVPSPKPLRIPVGGFDSGGAGVLAAPPDSYSPVGPPSPSPFYQADGGSLQLTDLTERTSGSDQAPRLTTPDFGSSSSLMSEFTLPDLPTPTTPTGATFAAELPTTPKAALGSAYCEPTTVTPSSGSRWASPLLGARGALCQGRSASTCAPEALAVPSGQKLSHSAPPTPLLSATPLLAPQPQVEVPIKLTGATPPPAMVRGAGASQSRGASARWKPECVQEVAEEADISSLDTDHETVSVSSWEAPRRRGSDRDAERKRPGVLGAPPPRGMSLGHPPSVWSRSPIPFTSRQPVMRSPSTVSIESDGSLHSTTSSQHSISSLTSASSAASVDMPEPIAEDDGDVEAGIKVRSGTGSAESDVPPATLRHHPDHHHPNDDDEAVIKRVTVQRVKSAMAMRMRVST